MNRSMASAWALVLLALAIPAVVASGAPLPSAPADEVAAVRDAIAREDSDGAIALAERLVASEPRSSVARVCLGRALGQKALRSSVFSQISWGKKCKKAFEEAVALDSENLDARFELVRYLFVAPGIAGGGHDLALAQIAEIARRNGARGLVAEGSLKAHEKDLAGAEAAFRRAIEMAPADPAAASALGSFLLRQKRTSEAVAFWKARVDTGPSDLLARYGFARAALASGTGLAEAADGLRAYLLVPPPPDAPSWADARWRLGLVMEKLGRKQDAIRELEEALRLVPGHTGAKKDLERRRKV
jgi:tetratricopeptide (TPR) repeat protein